MTTYLATASDTRLHLAPTDGGDLIWRFTTPTGEVVGGEQAPQVLVDLLTRPGAKALDRSIHAGDGWTADVLITNTVGLFTATVTFTSPTGQSTTCCPSAREVRHALEAAGVHVPRTDWVEDTVDAAEVTTESPTLLRAALGFIREHGHKDAWLAYLDDLPAITH